MSKTKDQQMAKYFKALGHPVRLQILRQLQEFGACFSGDISGQLPVVASTASQHLKILKEAGFIIGTVEGTRRCYCLQNKAFLDLKDWVARL